MKLLYLFCVILSSTLVLGLKGLQDPKNRPRVSITQGTLLGHILKSTNGREFEAFEGIPYAKPPVGKYRFKEPQAPKPWKGVWEAVKPGSHCMQYTQFEPSYPVIGDEDCLFVNVYRPKGVVEGKKLPVIVYIHGGCFMFGFGDLYGPRHLLDKNVIYVNLNYRVGPLGFLSTGDDVIPGNNGLKDQTAALRWIKENISKFGGDSDRITITGLSAGGASVHYHYLSPLSKGLFSRGISVSGTALGAWAFKENPLEQAQILAANLGCPTDNNKELSKCLRNRPANKIVGSVSLLQPWLYNPFSPFGPVVEQGGDNPFLSEHPVDIIKSKKVQDLPWIATVTSSEGLYPASEFIRPPGHLQELEDNWLEYAPYVLDYNYTLPLNQHKIIAKKVKQHYLKDQKISEDTFPELVQMLGDRLFVVPMEEAARLQAAATTSPVYFYKFSYRGQHSLSEGFSGLTKDYGASHADDMIYLLDGYMSATDSADDIKMTKIMVDFWYKYATDGKVKFGKVKWEPLDATSKDIRYLKISGPDEYQMTSSAELGHRSFWESIPFDENQHSTAVKDEL